MEEEVDAKRRENEQLATRIAELEVRCFAPMARKQTEALPCPPFHRQTKEKKRGGGRGERMCMFTSLTQTLACTHTQIHLPFPSLPLPPIHPLPLVRVGATGANAAWRRH